MNAYLVKEAIFTIHGEGARAGQAGVCLKFSGCNLWSGRAEDRQKGAGDCSKWCDTDFVGGEKMALDGILLLLNGLWPSGQPKKWVVITGGEPALQLDLALIDALHLDGWSIAVETNGTIDRTEGDRRVLGAVDWLTCSPKRGSRLVLSHAHELKIVLPGVAQGVADAGWTEPELMSFAATGRFDELYVQPQDVVAGPIVGRSFLTGAFDNDKNLGNANLIYQERVARCVAWVMAHPAWRLSLQTHKFSRIR